LWDDLGYQSQPSSSPRFGQSANHGICRPSYLAAVGGYTCNGQWHHYDTSHNVVILTPLYVLSLCINNNNNSYNCGSAVDARGLHSFVCRRAAGRSASITLLTTWSLAVSPQQEFPSLKSRTDKKRPDGVTLVPWQSGKSLCWDVTDTCPLAESYIDRAALETGAAAEMAATRKEEKYVDLGARHLLDDLGRRISENTGEARETSFLYQRISILVQRFNAVLLHDSLPATDCTD